MKRTAFTLIELLVVIAVIGMLVAITLPGINGSRGAARRAQCITKQRDLVTALTAYSTENNGLPGYLEAVGKYSGTVPTGIDSHRVLSWFAVLLPQIGENKRYSLLTEDVYDADSLKIAQTQVAAGVCPSAGSEALLSYVVNCGPHAASGKGNGATANADLITGQVAKDFTLFRDRRNSDLVALHSKVKLDEIPDGASSTVLLSENLQAGSWYGGETLLDELGWTATDTQFVRSSATVQNVGFVWSNKPVLLNPASAYTSSYHLNEMPKTSATGTVVPPSARPLSDHNGTVVVAYADGSVKAVNANIKLDVYLQSVCPDDIKAVKTVADGGLGYGNANP